MLSQIREKAASGFNFVKNNVRRVVTKAPKMKFFFGYYYKHCDVVENRILFESFHGSTVSDSPLFMLKELLSRPEAGDFEIYYSTNTVDINVHREFLKANNMEQVKLIPVSAYKYNKILATSKYLVNNSSFPVYFIKKEEQVYLQTWHGTPLKTLGKQMRMGIESMYNVQHNFLQADYLMHPNEFTKDAIMGDYNLESLYTGKVFLSGYPRNSIFMDKDAAKELRKRLGLEDKVVYAYMPTWRGTSNHAISQDNYAREVMKMLGNIDKKLKDNQVLYVNFHPILKGAIKLEGFKKVKPFPTDVNNYEFLNSVDALVTDYSSVFFDFSVTRKPIILFMYDFNEYMNDRGMYMDIRELPFVKVYKTKELIEWLSTEKILTASYDDGDYVEKFIKYDSADAPAKMLDLVLYGKEDNMKVFDYSKNKERQRRVVHPMRIKTKEDFETIKRSVKKDDIVLLERKYFSKSISATLYDGYNDDFDYVIITNTTPRTYIEDFFRICRGKKTLEKIANRELKRTFPHLNIKMPYVEDFYVPEAGTSISDTELKYVKAELNSDGSSMKIKLKENDKFTINKFMIFDAKGGILYSREVSKQEIKSLEISENFENVKSLMNMGDRYEIGGEFIDKSNNIAFLGVFHDEELKKINEKNVSRKANPKAFLQPVMVEQLGSKKNIAKYEKGMAAIIPIPYTKSFKNGFSLFVCKPNMVVNEYLHADINSIKSSKSECKVILKLDKIPGLEISRAVLRYRSAMSYDIPLDYEIKDSGSKLKIIVKIDFENMELRELYWDFRLIGKWYGVENEIKAKFRNNRWKYTFYLSNRQYSAGEGHMTFPYYTKGGMLSFMYRPDSEYDSADTLRKELLALFVYIFARPFLKRKKIWLVYEKFCSMAQDNGYYFFKYCMEKLSDEEKKNIYYVIDKRAADYEKIKQYDDHIIQFMSFRHVLYCLAAELYVASDSRTHLYAWRCKTSMIRGRISLRPIYFLQHGVTALKRDAHLFGKHGSSPMTYYATTSRFEQRIIVKYFDYTEDKVPINGFARWDVLEDKSDADDKIILIMPTWRSWLEEVSDEEFLASDYYKNYSHLLESKELDDILKKTNTRVIFYIHPKFAGYLKNFNISADRVTLIPFGTKPLNEIMMKCHMLITDYSSVCWDVYYMKKPVLFYQFDIDKYNKAHGSYIDMKKELFGRRSETEAELIRDIEECINSGFKCLDKDIENHKEYFEYIDDKNSLRTYKYLKNQGH